MRHHLLILGTTTLVPFLMGQESCTSGGGAGVPPFGSPGGSNPTTPTPEDDDTGTGGGTDSGGTDDYWLRTDLRCESDEDYDYIWTVDVENRSIYGAFLQVTFPLGYGFQVAGVQSGNNTIVYQDTVTGWEFPGYPCDEPYAIELMVFDNPVGGSVTEKTTVNYTPGG